MNKKTIIQEEIDHWRAEEKRAPPAEKYKFHGAVCTMLWVLSADPSLQELRDEYKQKEERSKRAEFKWMEWDAMARNRAVYGARAIRKLGIRLKED